MIDFRVISYAMALLSISSDPLALGLAWLKNRVSKVAGHRSATASTQAA